MSATMTEPRKNSEPLEGGVSNSNGPFSLRPSTEIRQIIDRIAARERRTRNQVMLMLIEEGLAGRGLYTPPSLP